MSSERFESGICPDENTRFFAAMEGLRIKIGSLTKVVRWRNESDRQGFTTNEFQYKLPKKLTRRIKMKTTNENKLTNNSQPTNLAKRRNLICAAMTLIAASFMPTLALAQNPAAIAVRSNGEADVVIEGPNNSLLYYHAKPGEPFVADTIAGNGTTFSAPAIAVRSTGEADVVAQGPNNSLLYYHATP